MGAIRLTAAQTLVRFLAEQYVERDGVEHRFCGGCFGIFGHGNVAGIGEALYESPELLTYYQARNEQAMVHTAVGYARMKNRLGTLACSTSIGPGATNLVTGAALATVNRVPVLLLPGDVFASRRPDPVLQQLEVPWRGDVSVNDSLQPVSRYFDRIERPEQLVPAALSAMRVLVNAAETGAVTLACPQDVQAEAYDFPDEFLQRRVWHVARPLPEAEALAKAAGLIRAARRPLIVPGGGVIYSDAADFDATKLGALALVGDARATLERLAAELRDGYAVDPTYREQAARLNAEWNDEVTRLYRLGHGPLPAQSEVIGAVNDAAAPKDVVVCAAGSMPGDLHKLWRTRDPKGYHVEYGYSCMGYEIAGGLGGKMAAPQREGYVSGGDGSYLILSSEIVTSIQEGLKLTIVLVDNRGVKSIGSLSRSLGTDGFGTLYRYRRNGSLGVDSENSTEYLPVDLAANAESLGAKLIRAASVEELRAGLEAAKAEEQTVVLAVEVDRYEGVPDYESWWDVAVAEVSEIASVQAPRERYDAAREEERSHV